jgi:hypothetical protein
MTHRSAALALLVVGLLQMTGQLTGIAILRDLGAATGASPAPHLLAAVDGFEAYAAQFFLECTREPAALAQLSPGLAKQLRGARERRNTLLAVLTTGPVLAGNFSTLPIFLAAASSTLCPGSAPLRELGVQLPAACGVPRLRVEPRDGAPRGDVPLALEPICR